MSVSIYEKIGRKALAAVGIVLFKEANGLVDEGVAILVGAGVPASATYGEHTLATGQNAIALDADSASADALIYGTIDGGTTWLAIDVGPVALASLSLPRGNVIRGSATGVGEALDLTGTASGLVGTDATDVRIKTIDDHGASTSGAPSAADTASGNANEADHAAATCTGSAVGDHGAITPAGNSDNAGSEVIGQLIPLVMYGAWAVDGDAVHTNGGGLVGQPAIPSAMGAAYCKVYDVGTTTWSNVALSSALAGWTANYQLTADALNEEVGDLFAFGFDVPTPEFAVDLSQAATWGGDGMKYTYSDGVGSTADLTVSGGAGEGYDNTDTTAQDGLQSLQQSGAITVEPPADWAQDTIDGQLANWIFGEITALQVTQTPILNSVQHDAVEGEEAWRVPQEGLLNALVVNDAAATLHTAQDVIFILWDAITGAHRKFTWAQDLRRERIACTPWALTTASRLFLYVIQEDGTNEPTVETIEAWADFSTTDHQHAQTNITVTPPAHAVTQPDTPVLAHTPGGHVHGPGTHTHDTTPPAHALTSV
jgi:hypothetical protein